METKGLGEGASGRTMDWEAVWNRHYPEVYRRVYRLVGNRRDADDVTSLAFERAWERFDHHDPSKGSILSLLYINAKTVAIGFRRRRREPELRLDLIPEEYGPSLEGPAELHAAAEVARIIESAISSLPGPIAAVIRCRHFEGMTWPEVACVLKMSLRNVHYLDERGRELLRVKLSASWPGAGFLHGPAPSCG